MRLKLIPFFFLLTIACTKGDRWSRDQGKKILFQMSPPVSQLDPQMRNDLASGRLLGKTYESLYEVNPYVMAGEVLPDLAAALPTISADRRTYTIRLRPGIVYHDCPCFAGGSRTLKAQDFVTTFKRIADPHLVSPIYNYWKKYISGLEAWHDSPRHQTNTDFELPLTGASALDELTLQLTINTPDPIFLYRLATLALSPIPYEAVAHYKNNLSQVMIGTGAFKLQRFDKSRFEFVKNPRFREKFFPRHTDPIYAASLQRYQGQRVPFLDGITVLISQESQTGRLQFLQGNVDFLEMAKDNAVEFLDAAGELTPEMKQKNIRVGATIANDNVYYLGLNNQHPLLKHADVRRAISLSIDRERYVELFFRGRARLAQGLIPASALPAGVTLPDAPYGRYRVDEARALLAQAAKKHGLDLAQTPLIIMVRNTVEGRQVGEFFVAQLSKIGLQVQLETMPINVLIERAHKGQYGLFYLAWFVGLPSPLEFFELLYGPNYPGSYNRIGMQDKIFDQYFERLQKDPQDLRSLNAMLDIVNQQVPLVPLIHASTLFAYHPWLMNYVPSETQYGSEQYFDIVRKLPYLGGDKKTLKILRLFE